MTDGHDARLQVRRHLQLLEELGVSGFSRDAAWTTREGGPEVSPADAVAATGVAPAAPPMPPSDDIVTDAAVALDALRVEIGPQCARCKLAALGRRQVVFGVGNSRADLMFAGEAPGADEDAQGEPFVGRAGQLLTKMIEAMGYARSDVYIANVIKCRPPGNRNPEPDEVATCEPFLFRQIDIIQPKVIVALGKFAAQTLLRTDTPITKLRGQVYPLRGARLVPTFHPAYLLRSPDKKRDAWEDLKAVMAMLREGA